MLTKSHIKSYKRINNGNLGGARPGAGRRPSAVKRKKHIICVSDTHWQTLKKEIQIYKKEENKKCQPPQEPKVHSFFDWREREENIFHAYLNGKETGYIIQPWRNDPENVWETVKQNGVFLGESPFFYIVKRIAVMDYKKNHT